MDGYGTYENVTWKREAAIREEERNIGDCPTEGVVGGGTDDVSYEDADGQVEVIIHENPLQQRDEEVDLVEAEVSDGSPIECNSNLMLNVEPRHTI